MFKAIVQQVQNNITTTMSTDIASRFRRVEQLEQGIKRKQEESEAVSKSREEALNQREKELSEKEAELKASEDEATKKEEISRKEVQLYQGAFAAEEEYTMHQHRQLEGWREAEEIWNAREEELENEMDALREDVAVKEGIIRDLEVTKTSYEKRIRELEMELENREKTMLIIREDNVAVRKRLEVIFKVSQL